jgi:hypothetical protein
MMAFQKDSLGPPQPLTTLGWYWIETGMVSSIKDSNCLATSRLNLRRPLVKNETDFWHWLNMTSLPMGVMQTD